MSQAPGSGLPAGRIGSLSVFTRPPNAAILSSQSTTTGDREMCDHLVVEADHLVERTKHRIDQYRRHIESMEHEGRESEGATLVLKRLQRVAVRLQIYRDMLQD